MDQFRSFMFERIYHSKTLAHHTCPLARVMRRELKKRGIKKQLVLFSTEKPTKPQFRGDATSPGTCSFVPPVAGFILAAHVLRTILEVPEQ